MKSLSSLWHLWSLIYHTTALRQLSARDPMHPDVPLLVNIVNDLKGKTR